MNRVVRFVSASSARTSGSASTPWPTPQRAPVARRFALTTTERSNHADGDQQVVFAENVVAEKAPKEEKQGSHEGVPERGHPRTHRGQNDARKGEQTDESEVTGQHYIHVVRGRARLPQLGRPDAVPNQRGGEKLLPAPLEHLKTLLLAEIRAAGRIQNPQHSV